MIDHADVVIIGAGIFGVSAAFYIARDTKLSVALIEKNTQGSGSSGRSASVVRHNYSTDLLAESALRSQKIFENFEKEVGEPVEFVKNGYLAVVSEEKSGGLKTIVERMKRFSVNVNFLSPGEISAKYPFMSVEGVNAGIENLDAGYVYDPQVPVDLYTRYAQKSGAKYYDRTRVTGIKTSEGRVRSVVTDRGEIRTDLVINASGPWAKEVGKMVGLDIPVESQRQQLVDLLPAKPWELTKPTISDHDMQVYVRPMKGGIAHVGGHYFGAPCDPDHYNTGADKEFIESVTEKISKRVPVLKGAKVMKGYSGLYENTQDTYPIVGESSEVKGFVNCVGWSGHGFKHGPVFGILLKELVETGRTSIDISSLRLERFEQHQLVNRAYNVSAPYG
ncbi:MAG: FAD-binding oxidoreductase [Thaumarchaeota archaeon]|nr:FAD-binding oxidoreductase [Nitrososphaerota archaeon]